MTFRVHNLVLGLDAPLRSLRALAAERMGVGEDRVLSWRVARRALDARGGRARFVYSVDVELSDIDGEGLLGAFPTAPDMDPEAPPLPQGDAEIRGRAAVVGCGPAGMMAALRLAENGYRPLVLERGQPVAARRTSVERFFRERALDPECNVLYGAGGAGTFSDGKLRTRTKDPRIAEVLRRMAEAGAPEEILYDTRPHVGTDRLRVVVETLCQRIMQQGGEIRWGARVERIEVDGHRVCAVVAEGERTETDAVVFAAGPYARDTMAMLQEAGTRIEAKPFQMGLRIEHPQEIIDRAVYGKDAGHPALGAADYVLSSRRHGVTSFCVCPGGVLLPAVSEPGALCTNGMSPYARDTGMANAALVTTVPPERFGGSGPLAGLDMQRRIEEIGFRAGGGDYTVPAQRASDYLRGRLGALPSRTTYPLGLREADLTQVVPNFVAAAVGGALEEFERRIRGFSGPDGLLVGPEARASCPVRVVRDRESRESVTVSGLFPAGAGSGYAAGIMSSAVDGLRSAEALIAKHRPGS